jgi:DNA-binding YbaB/EbfC family protein
MNQAQMMAQLRKMQDQMAKAQDELANTVVTGVASGDLVQVQITGDFRVKSVQVGKDAVDPEDVETLEDLLVVAFNDAIAKVQALSSQKLGGITGGLKIPGM